MNEDISRILQMLEDGKINADEAERLIKALREPESAGGATASETTAQPQADPFRDVRELGRMLREAQARFIRRQARIARWRHDQFARAEADARKLRAETHTPFQRVRHVLIHRVYVDRQEFQPDTPLRELMDVCAGPWERRAGIAWQNLRYGLEDEFGVTLTDEQVRGWNTVQDMVNAVSGGEEPGGETVPVPEPPVEPAAPARRRRPQEPEEMPAG